MPHGAATDPDRQDGMYFRNEYMPFLFFIAVNQTGPFPMNITYPPAGTE
ncbi:hypothetical protein [Komagataeibacter oboediens]|uniref:Uncharacterized protein n=1 Tax=Komagataeibacter oboediens TaxID=65958 RepID=A0ABS5SNF3_9PROT|nr:hypothetical protein [Komagataeibacter oboediens]MBL7232145.1 hypothetical protein [Komagataeibacter oboediens]MBT0675812.1 hypothetical protein [Komagataeibacter oboediens]MBT0677862.1 hypothetical protein [Komagataeibacter oboediens]MBV0887038.1 hypothetical protein [Komagataeibacter oboediens]MCK9820410.1 hypothetical protein [Komagataeibacter oboediens]